MSAQVRGTFPQAYRLDELTRGPQPAQGEGGDMAEGKRMHETGAQYRARLAEVTPCATSEATPASEPPNSPTDAPATGSASTGAKSAGRGTSRPPKSGKASK